MKPQNRFAAIIIIPALLLIIQACSSRNFTVRSIPVGSMILMSRSPNIYGLPDEICGISPVNKKMIFAGKKDQYYFKAINQGYEPDSVLINKDSKSEIELNLRKMESFSEIQKPVYSLKEADFCLLPVNTNIIIHKGVGNLDKYVHSDELSKAYSDSLDTKLKTMLVSGQMKYISNDNFSDISAWQRSSDSLSIFLLKLKSELLPYYPLPPAIPEKDLRLLTSLPDSYHLSPLKDTTDRLFVFLWCKSIEPTKGRVVGNIATSLASGAVQGYETASYGHAITTYNPQAFAIDNSTIWMVFVIEPQSGRILHISQHTLPYEITKPANLKKLTDNIVTIPQQFNNQNDEK
ncbi:MAG: hypothetical protein IPJ37_16580 [Bacteroidales bacterium]|nr:hypothetical protein [Bacteroidales bacterium]